MAKFRYYSALAAFSDVAINSNPAKNNVDWGTTRSLDIGDPENKAKTLAAGESITLFSGTRSLGINGSSSFTLALSTLSSSLYRLTWAGAGTAPAFRTDRALTNNTQTLVITANGNSTLTVTGPSGAFTGVVAGDTLFFPGPTTGDAVTPFSAQNEGYWLVLTASSTVLQIRRPTGTDFTGVAESVVVTANSQVQAYSAAGVQVGDTVLLSAGFSAGTLKSYSVVSVNPNWVEFYDTTGLPATETAVPGVAGLVVYTDAKRMIHVEYDQDCVIQVNGDSSQLNRLSPWEAADPDQTGWYERVGPCWSLTVVNVSQTDLNIFYFGAE